MNITKFAATGEISFIFLVLSTQDGKNKFMKNGERMPKSASKGLFF